MTKQEFMREMENALARLKPEERREILADFEEHFLSGAAGGKAEEEIARELGDPAALAAQYTEGLPDPKPGARPSGVAAGALASIALLLFNAIIAIPVIASLFAVWISLWSAVLALFAAALGCIAGPFTAWLQLPSAMAGAGVVVGGVALLALAALSAIGMAIASKWAFKGLAGYVKAHSRIIRGGSMA